MKGPETSSLATPALNEKTHLVTVTEEVGVNRHIIVEMNMKWPNCFKENVFSHGQSFFERLMLLMYRIDSG